MAQQNAAYEAERRKNAIEQANREKEAALNEKKELKEASLRQ